MNETQSNELVHPHPPKKMFPVVIFQFLLFYVNIFALTAFAVKIISLEPSLNASTSASFDIFLLFSVVAEKYVH